MPEAATGEYVGGAGGNVRSPRMWRWLLIGAVVFLVGGVSAVHSFGPLGILIILIALLLGASGLVVKNLPKIRKHLYGDSKRRPRRSRGRRPRPRAARPRAPRRGGRGGPGRRPGVFGRKGSGGKPGGGKPGGKSGPKGSGPKGGRPGGVRGRLRKAAGAPGRAAKRAGAGIRKAGRTAKSVPGRAKKAAGRGLSRATAKPRAAGKRAMGKVRQALGGKKGSAKPGSKPGGKGAGKGSRRPLARVRKALGGGKNGAKGSGKGGAKGMPRGPMARVRKALGLGGKKKPGKKGSGKGSGGKKSRPSPAVKAAGAIGAGLLWPVLTPFRKLRARRQGRKTPATPIVPTPKAPQGPPFPAGPAVPQPPKAQPGPPLDLDKALDGGGKPPHPGTGGTKIMQHPSTDALAESFKDNVAGYDPEHMADLDRYLHDLPEVLQEGGQSFSTLAEKLRGDHPVDAAVSDRLGEAAAAFIGMSDAFGDVYQQWRTAHEKDINRLEEPRPSEHEWDVANNPA